MIKVKHLQFQYPDKEFSLHIPELNIQALSSTAIIGPSGTGKTTLLNLMAGYLMPEEGQLHVFGSELTSMQEKERRAFRISHIGLVFQEFELLEYLSVINNILLPFRICPSLKLDNEVRQHAESLASEVGLGDKLHRNVKRLSQGERQRVAVCRALVTRPEVLMCDEPTGNLDPENKHIILDYLLKDVKQQQTTLVVVTHDHQLLPRFQRVIDFSSLIKQAAPISGEKGGKES
jgi:putative ABC transport system ATP-binding protein